MYTFISNILVTVYIIDRSHGHSLLAGDTGKILRNYECDQLDKTASSPDVNDLLTLKPESFCRLLGVCFSAKTSAQKSIFNLITSLSLLGTIVIDRVDSFFPGKSFTRSFYKATLEDDCRDKKTKLQISAFVCDVCKTAFETA